MNTYLGVKGTDGKVLRDVTDSSGLPVSLTGRNVQEIQIMNALAITDTINHDSATFDVSTISGRKYLHVRSSLNQSVKVQIIIMDKNSIAQIIPSASTAGKSIAAGIWDAITAADIRDLGEPLQKITVRLSCAVAPSSGSVSIWLEGVQQ